MPQNYDVFNINLNTAGSRQFDKFSGVFRFLRAVDGGGGLALDTLIYVRLGDSETDWIPLAPGNAIKAIDTKELSVKWDAHVGVSATVFRSRAPGLADVDADPPSKLSVGSMAAGISTDQVDVGTVATLIAAANSSRKSVTLQNVGSADVYIGPAGVTTATGYKLSAGSAFTLDGNTGAIYGAVAADTEPVHVLSEG